MRRGERVLFQEVQRPPTWAWVAVGAFFVAAFTWVWYLVQAPLISLLPLVPGAVIAALTLALTNVRTTVTSMELQVRAWPFGRRRVVAGNVVRCEVLTYRPLRDYGGWGWRWTPWRGSAYSMHGNRGVMVYERNGKRFLIGSQRPEELAAAIGELTAETPHAAAPPGPRPA